MDMELRFAGNNTHAIRAVGKRHAPAMPTHTSSSMQFCLTTPQWMRAEVVARVVEGYTQRDGCCKTHPALWLTLRGTPTETTTAQGRRVKWWGCRKLGQVDDT
jgi:hypothetical protein